LEPPSKRGPVVEGLLWGGDILTSLKNTVPNLTWGRGDWQGQGEKADSDYQKKKNPDPRASIRERHGAPQPTAGRGGARRSAWVAGFDNRFVDKKGGTKGSETGRVDVPQVRAIVGGRRRKKEVQARAVFGPGAKEVRHHANGPEDLRPPGRPKVVSVGNRVEPALYVSKKGIFRCEASQEALN